VEGIHWWKRQSLIKKEPLIWSEDVFLDSGSTYLEGDQRGRDADLRRRTNVPRSDGGPRGRVEDPGDPVSLGEQGAVHGAEAHANAEALENAGRRGRRGEEHEGVQVTHQHARQQDHGEFSSGSADHWGIAVLEEQVRHRQGRHDSQAGYYRRCDGEGAAPPDESASVQVVFN